MTARLRCIVLAGCLLCTPVAAQEPDTTALGVAPAPAALDSLVRTPLDLMGFGDALHEASGSVWALSDSIPALRPDVHLVELIAGAPGSFTYLFDRPGWPDGWSPFGLSPNTRPLDLDDIPFTDIFTGRPAWDLVPLPLIAPPRFDPAGSGGRPAGVHTQLRSYEGSAPLTEATYWRDGEGLQSIDVMHAQQRRRSLRGQPGLLQVFGAYGGRATNVAYPGSNLARGRRTALRVRYTQRAWSAEVLYLTQRRRIGAHGGVLLRPDDPDAIYRSDIAEVAMPEAERRIVRNDVAGTVRVRLRSAGVTSSTLYHSTETFRYHNALDTLGTRSVRTGVHVRQPLLHTAGSRLAIRMEGWSERIAPREAFRESATRRFAMYVEARDSLRFGQAGEEGQEKKWILEPAAGWFFHRSGGLAGSVRLARRGTRTSWRADASTGKPRTAVAYDTGFGTLRGQRGVRPGRTFAMHTEGSVRTGPFVIALGAFGHQARDPVDVFVEADEIVTVTAPSPLRQAALYADIGWRRHAQRGFYAMVRPTFMHIVEQSASPLHKRLAGTLPRWFGRARFGVRYALFQGDLRFDLYAEGAAWSAFHSRSLHGPTGLLAVPEASSLLLGASNTGNIVAEVRVRTARLFFVYDHAPAGASLVEGTMLVPVYPLPAGRFRFGVHWPILG